MKGDFKAPDRLTPEVLRMLADGKDHSGDYVSSWTGKAPEDDRRSGGEVVAKEVLRSARALLGGFVDMVLTLVAMAVCVTVGVFLLTVAFVLLS